MSNVNQLGQRQVPAGAMDVWNQSQAATALGMPAAPAGPAAPSPLAIAQRLLRGRVALAVVLASIGGLMGAAAGYVSQAPKYEADGMILVNPVVPVVEGDKIMPYYQQFMMTESQKLGSPAVINDVPKFEPWKSSFGKNEAALSDLAANLKTLYTKNTEFIGLTYITNDQKMATAGMQSLIKAYAAQFKQNTGSNMTKKIEEQQKRIDALVAQNDGSQKTINDIIAEYGSPDLQGLVTAAQNKVQKIDEELRGQMSNFQAATDAIQSNRQGQNKIPVEDLATVDPGLFKMLGDLRAAQLKEQLDEKQLGANHRTVITEKANIAVITAAVDQTAETLRQTILAIVPDFVKGDLMKITRLQYTGLETRVNSLKAELAQAKKERDVIAADAGKISYQQTDMKKYADLLAKANEHLTTMQFQAVMTGDLEVLQDGSFAAKAPDKKIIFGLAGAIAGAAVPVGLLMLMGLMDTRFRYSDDAAGHSMAGIPLLGILPNLPDRLSDPAQASIAAHCVHQIRTMLQLNAMRDHSTVFAVTSASSGDGKTSLSLALGLSFAASGSRTLLIDADLVGGGLTSRLGNDTNVGIVDALAGVGLEECVQPTDVSDLSLLPIGQAQSHHAGSFSPPAVRKLLNEVRKHYEVIIIDTGPVMGSIEATPICASVDGVVLTVARGQSRPLVERAITHLTSIGAKVAGVVFNRAQHKDFEQSIGAISIRSAARNSTANGTGHNGRNGGGMGAVASAVAGSVRN